MCDCQTGGNPEEKPRHKENKPRTFAQEMSAQGPRCLQAGTSQEDLEEVFGTGRWSVKTELFPRQRQESYWVRINAPANTVDEP